MYFLIILHFDHENKIEGKNDLLQNCF